MKDDRLHSQADFFASKYESPALGVLVSSRRGRDGPLPRAAVPGPRAHRLRGLIWHNATFLPLYQLILLFVYFVGFAAVLKVPGLRGEKADLALLQISKETLSAPVVGLIGATCLLTALVPGSMLLMVSSTVLAKNVYKVFVSSTSEQRVGTLARVLVPIVAALSLWFSLHSGQGMVLLLGYSLVIRLFLLGEIADTNIGIVALVVNFAVLLVVSLATSGLSVRREQCA